MHTDNTRSITCSSALTSANLSHIFWLLLLLQWKVRRTLAFSIHELAVILGTELTHSDLVPIFNGFIKDLDEVRIGVLTHLSDFLRVNSK